VDGQALLDAIKLALIHNRRPESKTQSHFARSEENSSASDSLRAACNRKFMHLTPIKSVRDVAFLRPSCKRCP
jgi:hypothetical protein